MTVCKYFLEGRCHYGDKCWNEHPRGGRNQSSRGGGGSVNRVWVNPSQRSGGGMVQPLSFSHGGGDWDRGNSATGRDDRGSNFSFNSQNRFSALSNTQSGYGRGGGGGGGGGGDDDISKQLEVIQKDMEMWQSSGQWIFSCYSLLKDSITGFVELCPEELRMEYYTSRVSGNVQPYVNSVQQLANQWRSRVQELRTMSTNTRAAINTELSNPRAQTPSGRGFGASSSTSTSGFGSSTASSTGFGSSTSGFGSLSYGLHVGGFDSSVQRSAAGFSFAGSSSGFGSSGTQPGFGSSTPSASTFSFADPAGATASKISASGFSFSSAPAGGIGSSSVAPASGGFVGFGGGASVTGSAEDKKSGGDNLYTPLTELSPEEHREFTAKRFTLGQIPLRPPPAELLTV